MSPHKFPANLGLLTSLAALAAASASAQPATAPDNTSTAPAAAPASPGEIVQMSKFEITTTQGKGYTVPNSVGGFKTSEKLLDIPQVDLVMTRDLLNDIGYDTTSEVLQFLGISATTTGESARIRGGPALLSLALAQEGQPEHLFLGMWSAPRA
jgi:outer membrane receptor protein involved in Fe transport